MFKHIMGLVGIIALFGLIHYRNFYWRPRWDRTWEGF